MRRDFREDKATQAAARLLALKGGRMSHLALIKLLYLAERESLTRFGVPLTYDRYVSMPYGPVLSGTLDRINEREMYPDSYWDRYIAPKQNHQVALRDPDDVPRDQLSPAEEALLDDVFRRHAELDQWALVALTHQLPEWVDPKGSSLPIDPADILRGEGYSEDDVAQMREEWDEAAYAASLFA